MGSFHSGLVVGAAVGFGTLVEGHDDIGAQLLLHSNHTLGGEAVFAAIQMRLESDPLLINLPLTGEREYLISTRIGQDGAFPRHKFV